MDEWVAAEIERQLQGVSVDEAEELSGENGGEELGLTESSQLMEHSQPAEMPFVASLFQGYLQALRSQHQTAELVVTDTKGTLAAADKTLLLKTEDLLSKHFADEWQEDLQSTLANKDEVLTKLEFELLGRSESNAPREANEQARSDEMKIGTPLPLSTTGTSPLAVTKPEDGGMSQPAAGDGELISCGNSDWKSAAIGGISDGPTAQEGKVDALEQSVSQDISFDPTPENSVSPSESASILISNPCPETQSKGDEVNLRSPSVSNPVETSHQTVIVRESKLRVPLHMAIAELEAEQHQQEEELRREQKEREAAIDAMIAESKKLRAEREKVLQERATEDLRRRHRAVTVLRAHWKGHRDRCRYGPLLKAARTRRLQEKKERMMAAQRLRERQHDAARVMQAHWRGYRCRRETIPALRERKEAERRRQLTAATIDDDHVDLPMATIRQGLASEEKRLNAPPDVAHGPPGQERWSHSGHSGDMFPAPSDEADAHLSAPGDGNGDLSVSQGTAEQWRVVSPSRGLTVAGTKLEPGITDSNLSVASKSADSHHISETPPIATTSTPQSESSFHDTAAVSLSLSQAGTRTGKFTVKKRIESALKLRERESAQEPTLPTDDTSSGDRKPKSVSLPGDIRTGTGHGTTGIQTSGTRIGLSQSGIRIGINLREAEKRALAREISRIQSEEDKRKGQIGEGKSPRGSEASAKSSASNLLSNVFLETQGREKHSQVEKLSPGLKSSATSAHVQQPSPGSEESEPPATKPSLVTPTRRGSDLGSQEHRKSQEKEQNCAKFESEAPLVDRAPSVLDSPSKRTAARSPLTSSSDVRSQVSHEKGKGRRELSKSSVFSPKSPETSLLSRLSEAGSKPPKELSKSSVFASKLPETSSHSQRSEAGSKPAVNQDGKTEKKLTSSSSKSTEEQEIKPDRKQESTLALNQSDKMTEATSSRAATDEDGSLAREQQAMAALIESREREEMAAQIARDKMSKLASAEQLAQAAKTRRSHSTYQRELEHASTPLSPQAWVGVVVERLQQWRDHHSIWKEPAFGPRLQPLKPCTPPLVPRSTAHARPLSNAQLLSASPRGTKLEQATQVVAYRSRAPIDLACLSKCPRLHSLSLMKCGVTSLTGIAGCPHLLEISMSSNAMESTDLSNLPGLRFLDLSDNRLASIHGLERCTSLLELSLAENRIARVGRGVSGCPRLQKVVLDGNLIINCKGLQDLSLLQHFSCAENHLPRMDSLDSCCLLQTLRASQNNIQELPSLKNFVLLRELALDENSLCEITAISQAWLPLLQTLSLANNCITELQSLASLLMLQTLDVSNNSLYDLPDLLQCIRGSFELKGLSIQGNPITEEPKFRTHILKVLPNLQQLDGEETKRSKAPKLHGAITSSKVYQLCRRQLLEQDGMREKHLRELEGSEEAASPDKIAQICNLKVSHCMEYQQLLIRHLQEHEGLVIEGTDSRPRTGVTRRPSIKHGSSPDLRFRAAVVIQSAWRGRKTRQLLWQQRQAVTSIQRYWRKYCTQKLQKMHKAATVIQAHYRGYRLRRRLQEVLSRARYVGGEGEGEEEEGDLFNYEEEITLDCVDESLLDGDLKPLSPKSPLYGAPAFLFEPQLVPTLPPKPRPVMLPSYVLPGAVESEVPLETWRQQQKLQNPLRVHHIQDPFRENESQQRRQLHPARNEIAGTETPHDVPSSHTLGESPRTIDSDPSHLRPLQPKAQLAWGSVTELPEVHGNDDIQSTLTSEKEGEELSCEAGARLKREQIADEWGFKSSATAELMLKRARRQRKLQAQATRRKKLADPGERLAVFKKLKEAERREEGRPRVARGAQRVDYFRASSSVKSSPSPDPEESQAKDDFLYHWVHEQHVVHEHNPEQRGVGRKEAGPRELQPSSAARRQPKKNWCPTSSFPGSGHSSLPPIEPHVLAGHTPRLVSSQAQNQIAEIGLQPQRTESERRQLKAQSMQGTDFNSRDQGSTTEFQDSPTRIGSHSVPTMRLSFKK